jgi:hypothetical protein
MLEVFFDWLDVMYQKFILNSGRANMEEYRRCNVFVGGNFLSAS